MSRSSDRIKLYKLADNLIGELAGVSVTEKQSFRIGAKVFVRTETDAEIRSYCFKLPTSDGLEICSQSSHVTPRRFGNMGDKGWVSFRLTQKRQLPLFRKLIEKSYALFR